MSTLVFVDLEISTQADGAQSPRVPVPFLEDPYEAIRQAYLVETETPESPHTVASPTPLPDSTPPTRHAEDSVDSDTSGARPTSSDFTAPLSPDHPLTHASPTLVPFLRRTARMAVRVPPAMSPGLSASIAEVAAMSDSAFRKRFRSSYESSPSSSPPDLPSRKRYRAPSIVPSPISSPMIPLTITSYVTIRGGLIRDRGGLIRDHMLRLGELSPALFERYNRDIGELFTRSGVVRDEIFSQRYQFRSLEHKDERVAVTFGAIWRPVLALK
ncbi:hypothetical protein Tco_0633805 [Tanacetum coccineum]